MYKYWVVILIRDLVKMGVDWEDRQAEEKLRIAKLRAKRYAKSRGGAKCLSCGLYGCVCQDTLERYVKK